MSAVKANAFEFPNVVQAMESRSVDAYLDWLSGLVWLNRTQDEFASIMRRSKAGQTSDDDRHWLEVLTHEHAHVQQIVTLGWPYKFAVELFEVVRACVNLPNSASPSGVIQFNIPDDVWERLSTHVSQLDDAGSSGITTRSLLEGLAYYVQKRLHWSGLSHKAYVHALHEAPSDEYAIAYGCLLRQCGSATSYDIFPAAASAALCTSDPSHAYETALDALTWEDPRRGQELLLILLNKLSERVTMLGSSAEMINRLPRAGPTWPKEVIRVNDRMGEGAPTIFDIMSSPERTLEYVVSNRPLLLRSSGNSQAFWLTAELLARPRVELQEELQVLTYVAAAGGIIAQTVPLPR